MQASHPFQTVGFGNSSPYYQVLDFIQKPDSIRHEWTYINDSEYYFSQRSSYPLDYIQEDSEMLVDPPEFQESSETAPTLTELRNRTTAKTAYTSGTDLDTDILNTPRNPAYNEHTLNTTIRNLAGNGDFNAGQTPNSNDMHHDSMNSQSTQNLSQISDNSHYDNINGLLMKIEPIVRPRRLDIRGCPARARVTPVKWWLGERITYNKEGKISGKLRRCNA